MKNKTFVRKKHLEEKNESIMLILYVKHEQLKQVLNDTTTYVLLQCILKFDQSSRQTPPQQY